MLASCTTTTVVDDVPELPPIKVADGFEASVFHPALGATRHIAVRDNGDVYVAREFRIETQDVRSGSRLGFAGSDA